MVAVLAITASYMLKSWYAPPPPPPPRPGSVHAIGRAFDPESFPHPRGPILVLSRALQSAWPPVSSFGSLIYFAIRVWGRWLYSIDLETVKCIFFSFGWYTRTSNHYYNPLDLTMSSDKSSVNNSRDNGFSHMKYNYDLWIVMHFAFSTTCFRCALLSFVTM